MAYGLVFLAVRRVARSAAPDGSVIVTYAVLYGAVRFGMEFFRGRPGGHGWHRRPQALRVLLAVAGAVGLSFVLRKRRGPGETAGGPPMNAEAPGRVLVNFWATWPRWIACSAMLPYPNISW